MRVLIVYESLYGTNQTIAEAIADGIVTIEHWCRVRRSEREHAALRLPSSYAARERCLAHR